VQAAITQLEQELPFEVPVIINGEPVSPELCMCLWTAIGLTYDFAFTQVKTGKLAKQLIPSDHARHICTYHEADESTVARAIEGALAARAGWEAMPWGDRAAIFLKAADLVSQKYRYKLMAATILGQGKNVWQAEIDAAAEVSIVDVD
jgi:1-pyrroline-5-carboxylate dehydrogenase